VSRFYLKAVHWNTNRYQKPSGERANSGYPHKHGYGNEEWNNSPALIFRQGQERFRAFHTEELGKAPVADNAGQMFVFMYASHDKIQQLVGAAGRATCLVPDDCISERIKLARSLGLQKLWKDAWRLKGVRDCYEDKARFLATWRENLHWLPNWKCPADLFFWPAEPVTVDPGRITGKSRLLNEFGSYTEIGPDAARSIMAMVPVTGRTNAWSLLLEAIDGQSDGVESDLEDVRNDRRIGETTRQALIEARLGQGRFRAQLVAQWGGACAVTGCNQAEVLRASHIKPWRASANEERLDPQNGLLLSANLDALFDRGLVSFKASGEMLVSSQVAHREYKRLGIPAGIRRKLTAEERAYMAYHRGSRFIP
jgi:hypothetical protein